MALQMRLMMLLPPLLMPNHDTLAPLGAACAKVGVYKSCNRDTWQDAPTHQHLPGHFRAICNPWGSSWASPGGVTTFKFISWIFLDAYKVFLPWNHIFKVLFQVMCRIFNSFIKHNWLKTKIQAKLSYIPTSYLSHEEKYKYSYKYSHLKIYPPFPLTAPLQGTLPLLQMLLLLLSFFLRYLNIWNLYCLTLLCGFSF